MIETFSKFAKKYYWLRPILHIVSFAFLALFIYLLLSSESTEKDAYLIPCILGFLWSLLFSSMFSIFPNFPQKVDPEAKFFQRIKQNVVRGFYFLLLVLFVGVSIGVVMLSMKMANIWFADY